MNIEQLRRHLGHEEVDYQSILSALRDYAYPRDKIRAWLKSGELIRVKKGLYVFGKHVAQQPYSPEVLANLIYGPSAISLTYALSYYGMIPERVTQITSITPKRKKYFTTPVGDFTYYYLSPKKYPVGIEIRTTSTNKQFLIASPEKALCDQLYLMDKHTHLKTCDDVEAYLLQDLRIDETALDRLYVDRLIELSQAYKMDAINTLAEYINKRNHHASSN